jgi:hypothetical protein
MLLNYKFMLLNYKFMLLILAETLYTGASKTPLKID